MNLTIDSGVENIIYNGNDVEELIFNGNTVWTKTAPNYALMDLTFQILTDGTITFTSVSSDYVASLNYTITSVAGHAGSTGTITSSTTGASLNLYTGQKISFHGSASTWNITPTNHVYFGGTATFNAYGNASSVYAGTNSLENGTYNLMYLSGLFKNCTGIISAKNLYLFNYDNSNLGYQYDNIYKQMFYKCSNLTAPPEIIKGKNYGTGDVAFTVVTGMFYDMFTQCTKITKTPVMNVGIINASGCRNMFSGCTSLKDSYITFTAIGDASVGNYGCSAMFYNCTKLENLNITELPYTTIRRNAYANMYRGAKIVTAPEIKANNLNNGQQAMYSMFYNCSSLKYGPSKLYATTLTNQCYYIMFYGCTSLETAPILPATTLVSKCYEQMFDRCNKLNYIKALFTTTPSDTYTKNWVRNVSASGTFVKNSSASWSVTGTNGIPSGWSIQTASS